MNIWKNERIRHGHKNSFLRSWQGNRSGLLICEDSQWELLLAILRNPKHRQKRDTEEMKN